MATDLSTAISRSKHYNDGTKDFNTIVKDGSTSPFFSKTSDASALDNWTGYWYLGDTSIFEARFTNGTYVNLPYYASSTTDSSFHVGKQKLAGATSTGVYYNRSITATAAPIRYSDSVGGWCSIGCVQDSNTAGLWKLTINASANNDTSARTAYCYCSAGNSSVNFEVRQAGITGTSIPVYVRLRWSESASYTYNNSDYALACTITGEGDQVVNGSFTYTFNSAQNGPFQGTVDTEDSSNPFVTTSYAPIFYAKSSGSVSSADCCVGVLCSSAYNHFSMYQMTFMYAKPGFDPAATVYKNYTPAYLASSSVSSANRFSYIGSTQSAATTNPNTIPVDGDITYKVDYWRSYGDYNGNIYTTDEGNSSLSATVGAFLIDIYLYS